MEVQLEWGMSYETESHVYEECLSVSVSVIKSERCQTVINLTP